MKVAEADSGFDIVEHWRQRAAHFRLNNIPGADFCDSRAHELEAARKKAMRESTGTVENVATLKARISELEASVAKKRNGK